MQHINTAGINVGNGEYTLYGRKFAKKYKKMRME